MATAGERAGHRRKVADTAEDPRTAEFREWLRVRLERVPKSINAIEKEAGIPGNALGKFLRGERGRRHSLTPLHIQRLAPVIGISEETMLARAGHLSHLPDEVTIEQAILGDRGLDYEDKRFLIEAYRRTVRKGEGGRDT
ncbi:MAG: hypothetical protein C0498_01605 [Anaerolinea sp.]|nr:hypothetical protein [Anaerolinea sp.]